MKVDYSKCKIYKLVDTINSYFYIGSTCDTLSKRLCAHRSLAKTKIKQKVYTYFNQIGWENVRIILIIDYPECNNLNEKLRKEQEYIDQFWNDEKCLNSMRSFLSEEQKYNYHKDYSQLNTYKEYKKEYNKEYNKTEKSKQIHKEYYERNKEKKRNYMKEYNKQYYETNREREQERVKKYREEKNHKLEQNE